MTSHLRIHKMVDASSPEEILERIGGCGRFQVLLCAIMHLMKAPTVFSMVLTMFAIARPKWWCADRLDTYNVSMTTVSESPLPGIEMMTVGNIDIDLDHDIDRLENCMNLNGSACSEYIYDQSMNTIVSEWDMVCDLSWIPSMIASIQMGGLLVGNIVCGQLADSIGRKIPTFSSLVIIIVASLISYFATGMVMFAAGRVLSGFGMGCFLTVQYSMVSEMTLARVRPWVVALPSWPVLTCLWCLIAYLVPDWRNMHLVVALITVPFLATWWFIPDSFRWYLSHDRRDDARRVIQYIAKFNAHDIADDVTDAILKDVSKAETGGDHKKYSLVHMFKTKRLTKLTLLLTINWFSLGLVSYGISFGIQALSGNFFLNIFFFSVITIPLYFVAIWMCNRFGRRQSIIMCYSVTAVGGLVVGIIQYINISEVYRSQLTSAFAMVASLGVGTAWGPVATMTQELYPTVIRNIAYGYLNVFARIGAMLAPQLAFLDTKVAGLMYFLCSFLCVICVIGSFALSETRGRDLNDKIQQKVIEVFVEDKKHIQIK